MKKSMERMRVKIDQSLNRTEKSVALSTELLRIEETISIYKQVCQTIHKKLSEGLQGFGKGTDGPCIERRLKKTVDFTLGQTLIDAGRLLTKQNGSSCLGQVLVSAGGLCTAGGSSFVQYELSVEQLVLGELDVILKRDLPVVTLERKQLDKLLLDLDTVKARLDQAREEEHSKPGGPARVERLSEELEDTGRRVEQARDQVSTTMMLFMAREAEFASLVAKYLNFKLEYHQSIVSQVLEVQPTVNSVLSSRRGFPIFGTDLHTHLESFSLSSGIAYPLQLCISRLIDLGLEEEGLFRLAAGSSKVKRLKAEFEAGLACPASLEEISDHHLLATIIKSYLRDLPEPLLGAELYEEWLEASSLTGDERFDVVWNLLQSEYLPRENYKNIHYLFKFLNAVTKQSDANKMTASNVAIVITPNVLWECEKTHDTMDVNVGNSLATVVELIITQFDWFFQNDADIEWRDQLGNLGNCQLPILATPHSPGGQNSDDIAASMSSIAAMVAGSTSLANSSPVPATRDRKFKGKKAPAPPTSENCSPGASPSPLRSQHDPSPPQHHTPHHDPSPQHQTSHPPSSPSVSPRDKSHDDSFSREKSIDFHNGSSFNRTISHPPIHPPPHVPPQPPPQVPPSHPPPKPPPPANNLYPDLARDIETLTAFPIEKNDDNANHERSFPVPAPRSSKPALPNKPEGLSRNVSMRDPATITPVKSTKESTNL